MIVISAWGPRRHRLRVLLHFPATHGCFYTNPWPSSWGHLDAAAQIHGHRRSRGSKPPRVSILNGSKRGYQRAAGSVWCSCVRCALPLHDLFVRHLATNWLLRYDSGSLFLSESACSGRWTCPRDVSSWRRSLQSVTWCQWWRNGSLPAASLDDTSGSNKEPDFSSDRTGTSGLRPKFNWHELLLF